MAATSAGTIRLEAPTYRPSPKRLRGVLIQYLTTACLTALCLLAFALPGRTDTLTNLFNFSGPDGPAFLESFFQAHDGNFYGVGSGGQYNLGCVFRVSPTGVLTPLHSFTPAENSIDGGHITLIEGTDGNFYGTTEYGGILGRGTIFKITAAGVLTTLHICDSNGSLFPSDSAFPSAALVQGKDGNLYGETWGGAGTIFKITTGGTFTMLYDFKANNSVGSGFSALIQATDGNLYGTGMYSNSVFKITTSGKLTPLYIFSALSSTNTNGDGAWPNGLIQDTTDGNLYGTAQNGGMNGTGTIFKIGLDGTFTPIHTFSALVGNRNADGASPVGALVQGKDGYLYGATTQGGPNGTGTIFKIGLDGTFTPIYNSGLSYLSALVQGKDGYLYGGSGSSSIFKITTAGVVTPFCTFVGPTNGVWPQSSLVQTSNGDLFGTTVNGGLNGDGTIFRLAANGTLETLYTFSRSDGGGPGGLTLGKDGNLYGTTAYGGAGVNPSGTVFQITPAGHLTPLHSFGAGPNDSSSPLGTLLQAKDGYLYGTTQYGGASSTTSSGYGTIFKIALDGTGYQILHTFAVTSGGLGSPVINTDGAVPYAGLIQGKDDALYGTTTLGGANETGTIFRMTTAGDFSVLYTFSAFGPNNTIGGSPTAPLALGPDGNFYGISTQRYANASSGGTIFQITRGGAFTPLVTLPFSYFPLGDPFEFVQYQQPSPGLVRGSDGNLYGTALGIWNYQNGFDTNNSMVFKMTTDGTFTPLYTFSPVDLGGTNQDGWTPFATLMQGKDGRLYGTTFEGGKYGQGTIFKFSLTGPDVVTPSPSWVYANTDLTLTLGGSGFVSGSVVNWNGHALNTTCGNAGQLTATVPAALNTPLATYPGSAQITVVNPDKTSGNAYVRILPPAPILQTLAPASLPVGSKNSTLTVLGRLFSLGDAINWNGTPLTTTFVSPGKLTAVLPSSLLTAPGTAWINVTSPGNYSGSWVFTITGIPVLQLTVGTPSRDSSGNILVPITLNNTGSAIANSLQVTSGLLGIYETTNSLPLALGNLGMGSAANVTLTYPGGAGKKGQKVKLMLVGSYQGADPSMVTDYALGANVTLP